ncbi:hypothetical protein GGX14DRAFT_674425, partial [Mycena pura]
AARDNGAGIDARYHKAADGTQSVTRWAYIKSRLNWGVPHPPCFVQLPATLHLAHTLTLSRTSATTTMAARIASRKRLTRWRPVCAPLSDATNNLGLRTAGRATRFANRKAASPKQPPPVAVELVAPKPTNLPESATDAPDSPTYPILTPPIAIARILPAAPPPRYHGGFEACTRADICLDDDDLLPRTWEEDALGVCYSGSMRGEWTFAASVVGPIRVFTREAAQGESPGVHFVYA